MDSRGLVGHGAAVALEGLHILALLEGRAAQAPYDPAEDGGKQFHGPRDTASMRVSQERVR